MSYRNENEIVKIKSRSLTRNELIERIYTDDPDKKIYITPLIDPDLQIGSNSIDIRLGTEFVVFNRIRFSSFDLFEIKEDYLGELHKIIYLKLGEKIFLHPNEFVLGTTLEYIKLPSDIMGYITTRSTFGRLGLIIATAISIHPNYAGVITLELKNIGEVPIPLYPGLRIAQIIFHFVESTEFNKPSKYFMSIRPTFTKIFEEPEWKKLRELQENNIATKIDRKIRD